jgi:hypothetical protein
MTTYRRIPAGEGIKPPVRKPWVQPYPNQYIETLARDYCTNLGLDPDEGVQVDFDRTMLDGEFQGGAVYDVPCYRWQLYRKDVVRALAMRAALRDDDDWRNPPREGE